MKFMMFVCTDTTPDNAPDGGETTVEAWSTKNDAAGVRLAGDRQPAGGCDRRAQTRRQGARDGRSLRCQREWIAGFDIFECADLDEAIAVAADHEMARHATAPTAEATDWPATTLSRA